MFSFEEYLWGWSIYILAVLGLLMAFWRLTRSIPWFYLKQCLRLVVATLLLTPAMVGSSNLYWAPAWIQGVLQLIFVGLDDFYPIGRLLLMVVLIALVFYLLTLIAQRLYQHWRSPRA